jgi:alpha-1,3-fucosyltransferase
VSHVVQFNLRLLNSKLCREKISKQYLFFLAFENSLCKDYVTEKLFETLLYDIVPVVYGGVDYSYWIPRSGYINVADFKSVQALTNFLKHLSSNSTAYNSYFEWKRHIRITNTRYKMFCDVCIKLHLEDYFGKMKKNPALSDMVEYFGERSNCQRTLLENDQIVWMKA